MAGAGQDRLRATRGLQRVGELGLLGGDHRGALLGDEALPRRRQRLIAAGVVAEPSWLDHCPADATASLASQEVCCWAKSFHCEITAWAWLRWASSAALHAAAVSLRSRPSSAWPSSLNQAGDHHAAVGCLAGELGPQRRQARGRDALRLVAIPLGAELRGGS